MSDRIKVFALGGLDEKGRDCYVVEINDDIFVLDAGISIPDKNYPGVDCLLPNFDYLVKNKNRIKAYIMTHGHDENVGALKYIYKFAPAKVYCTQTTKAVIECQMVIHHMYVKFDFEIVKPSDDIFIGGRKISLFQTCHNAANSFGVAISTDQGNIIYTSDFIINFATEEKNYQFDLEKVGIIAREKTLLLLTESNASGQTGYCSPKHRINDLVEKYFKADKRIFATCYWQNMYRVREICRLAKKYNKRIYCYDDYTRQIIKDVYIKGIGTTLSENDFIKREDFLRVKRSEMVILILGDSDDVFEDIKALGSRTNADSRIIVDKEDIFINAALPRAYFETTATRAIDNMYRTGCEVVWLKSKNVMAMHACEDDLRFAVNLFKPKYYFPVRGNYLDIMKNAKQTVALGLGLNHMNVFVLDNGMELIIDGDKRPIVVPNERNDIDISPILVDGKGIAKITDDILETRQRLAVDGIVVIAGVVSLSKKCFIAGPDCQMRGFVFVKEAEPLLKSISQIFIEEVNLALANGDTDFEQAKTNIKERARKFIRRENGREPYIDPIILIKQ